MAVDVASADNDVRYVPRGTADFSSIAHESRYRWLTDTFDLTGKRVLDFGCGSGYGAAYLASYANTVVGVDYSSTAIEYASRQYPLANLRFLQGNATTTDILERIGEREFDYVVSFDVIEHVERYFEYLENIHSLMANDGVAVIGCPNRLQTFPFNGQWNPFHFQEFSPHQLRKILSMYFSEVTLFSQDIQDQGLRKRIVEMNQPRKWQPFLRRKRRQLRKVWSKLVSRGEPFSLRIDDVVIRKEPAQEMLNQAFGLLAVCRR